MIVLASHLKVLQRVRDDGKYEQPTNDLLEPHCEARTFRAIPEVIGRPLLVSSFDCTLCLATTFPELRTVSDTLNIALRSQISVHTPPLLSRRMISQRAMHN